VKRPETLGRIPVFILLLAVVVVSCRSEKIVSEAKIKPMSAERIIRKIEDNALDYRNFSVKRISCQVDDGENRTTFRANLSTQKDKSIVISFNKLNIPVGRILLTPDSIKYVNHLEKNYFSGNYSFLEKMFNVGFDFNDMQAIIGYNLMMLDGPQGSTLRDYTADIESGKYILRSEKMRKIKKIEKAGGRKEGRTTNRAGNEIPVVQTIVVDTKNFNIDKIRIEEQGGTDWLQFVFDDYTKVGGRDYPGSVDIGMQSSGSILSVKLRLAGFDKDKPDVSGFKIPEKYEKIEFLGGN
jgi:hypothetical protein